jgi:hypothetical protein
MLPDIDMSAAVEFPPDIFAELILLALLAALLLVPSAVVVPGALLPIAAMVLVSMVSVPLLTVLFFTTFVFAAIVVVVSCAATVQAMKAARRIDEYRIFRCGWRLKYMDGTVCRGREKYEELWVLEEYTVQMICAHRMQT